MRCGTSHKLSTHELSYCLSPISVLPLLHRDAHLSGLYKESRFAKQSFSSPNPCILELYPSVLRAMAVLDNYLIILIKYENDHVFEKLAGGCNVLHCTFNHMFEFPHHPQWQTKAATTALHFWSLMEGQTC